MGTAAYSAKLGKRLAITALAASGIDANGRITLADVQIILKKIAVRDVKPDMASVSFAGLASVNNFYI